MQKRMLRLMGSLAVLAAVVALPGSRALADDWEWTLSPYVWAAGISMDVDARDEPVLGVDVGFSDLLDKTDLAAMAHFEGRNGSWGFLFDALYLDAGAERSRSARPPLPGSTDVSADLTTVILEGAAVWRPFGHGRSFDVIFGLRRLELDSEVQVDAPAPFNASTSLDASGTWVDGFVGARYSVPFAKRWDFAIRGDIGTGDTERTWNAVGSFGVRLGQTDRYSVRFGYRHMAMELKNDDNDVEIETDLALSGAIASFDFHW